ncbi:MAG: serine hydrolase [Pseudomonadales bacterium]
MDNHWDKSKLQEAIDFAQQSGTAQLNVVHNGITLIDEVFASEPVDVYAVQKGILALLIGVAQEKYLLETLDNINHHLDPEWTNLGPWDEAKLTIEILMTMTTGMDDELNAMGTIGESWRYNNTAYNYLKEILCLQSDQDLNGLSKEWLFDPLDMNDTNWVNRDELLPDGTPFTGLLSTANDLSKVGRHILKQNGRPKLDQYYLDQLGEPGSNENPAWGLLWWNNNQALHMVPYSDKIREGNINPAAPEDTLFALGALGNQLAIVPSLNLVVARTTAQRKTKPGFEVNFWEKLLAART